MPVTAVEPVDANWMVVLPGASWKNWLVGSTVLFRFAVLFRVTAPFWQSTMTVSEAPRVVLSLTCAPVVWLMMDGLVQGPWILNTGGVV